MLSHRLHVLVAAHSEAVRTLEAFVRELKVDIQKSMDMQKNLAVKLDDAVARGTSAVQEEAEARAVRTKGPDGQDVIRLSFSQREFSLMRHVVNDAYRLTERFPSLLLEMAFIYRVAISDALITDILAAVLVGQPNLLKTSKKTLTYDQVVDLQSIDSIVSYLAGREMLEFSYASVEKQSKWIEDRLGIQLTRSESHLIRLIEMSARRNLLVHNNGIVNDIYLRLVSNSTYSAGQRVRVTDEYWAQSDELLIGIADDLLESIFKKFCSGADVPHIQRWVPLPPELESMPDTE